MNARVFFVDESNTSRHNGIGTFRDTLMSGLYTECRSMNLISLNSDCREIKVERRAFGLEFRVPYVDHGRWRYNGIPVASALRLYISDDCDNVFILNHSPCSAFITAMRQSFPMSKFVFVIHDQGWCTQLSGDSRRLKMIVSGQDSNPVTDYFKEELNIYSLVDAVVCLSPSTLELLIDVYGLAPDKCRIIVNGIAPPASRTRDRGAVRDRLGISQDEKLIVFSGRPTYMKGTEILLKALGRLRKSGLRFRCAVIGSMAAIRDFEREIAPVASSMIFTGHIPRKDVQDWYSVADLGVIPSYTEQCSYTALEMMRSGVPMVVSDGNGLRDMFTDRKNAFVAKISRNNSIYARNLSNAIVTAFSATPDVIGKMTRINRHLIRTQYSLGRMYDSYIKLLATSSNNQ